MKHTILFLAANPAGTDRLGFYGGLGDQPSVDAAYPRRADRARCSRERLDVDIAPTTSGRPAAGAVSHRLAAPYP